MSQFVTTQHGIQKLSQPYSTTTTIYHINTLPQPQSTNSTTTILERSHNNATGKTCHNNTTGKSSHKNITGKSCHSDTPSCPRHHPVRAFILCTLRSSVAPHYAPLPVARNNLGSTMHHDITQYGDQCVTLRIIAYSHSLL